MNKIIELFKKGSGIHIKKENRGKFTDYCGGKVTSACIAKGKSSSNPAIRKRATFAANARKWKHKTGGSFKGYPSKAAYEVRLEEVAGFKKGGIIKVQEGTKMNWGQFAVNGISSLASAYLQNKQASSNGDIAKSGIDMNLSQKKLQLNQQAEQQTDQILNNMNYLFNTGQSVDNSAKSDIFRRFLKNKIASQGLAALDQEANNQKSMIDAQISQAKSESFGNAFSGILQQGLGMVGNYLANKQPKNQATSQV